MIKLKYVSIDVETSGKRPWCDQILSFAAVIDDLKTPVADLPKWHKVIEWEEIRGEPFAIAMNAEIIKKIADKDYKEKVKPNRLGIEFKNFLLDNGYSQKYNRVMLNAAGKNFDSFDRQFLIRHEGFEDSILIPPRVIDPTSMWLSPEDERPPDLKQCLERAGVVKEISHDALDDALDVIYCIRADARIKMERKKNATV